MNDTASDPLAVQCPACDHPAQGLRTCPTCGEFVPLTLGCGQTPERESMAANDYQVGGDHYRRLDPQPWDLFAVYEEIDHFTATAMTYIIRHAAKGGADDLGKAIHWLRKLCEITERAPEVPMFGEAMERWQLPVEERYILLLLLTWSDTGNIEHVREAVERLDALRALRYPPPSP